MSSKYFHKNVSFVSNVTYNFFLSVWETLGKSPWNIFVRCVNGRWEKHYYMLLYFESLNAFYNCFHICKIVNCVQPDTFLKTQTLLCIKNFLFTFFPCRSSSPIQGGRDIGARFLKLSPALAVSPILTKFSQYTPHFTYYSVPVSIYRQNQRALYRRVREETLSK